MEYETIIVDRPADGVAVLTLNRPERGNGVVPELARDMVAALTALEADLSVRVLVLTGAGKVFCAGADLVEFKAYLRDKHAKLEEPFNMRVLWPMTQRVVTCRMPVIAALNGAATAGGLDLAMACDMRLAASTAKLGETYVKLGLSPGNGGSYFLPRLVGSGLAAEMAFTGDLFDAQRAHEIGLVNRVVEPDKLMPEAIGLAERIAKMPRGALEAIKQQLRQSWHMDLPSLMSWSYWSVAALTYSADLREGIDAALEKRPPIYNKKDSG